MRYLSIIFLMITVSASSSAQSSASTEYICPPCPFDCHEQTFNEPGKCTVCSMEFITKAAYDLQMNKKKRIAFYLQDRVEVLDFAGPMEVFAYAGYEVFTVSKTKDPIRSQGIVKIIPDYSIDDAPEADILAFFGGNSGEPTNDTAVIEWVRTQKNVDYHFSVCTGAFILAEAGILDHQDATTFHTAIDGLTKNYPKTKVHRNARFVDNGKVVTTAGVSAGIDGALHMVAKLDGFNAARSATYYMEYDKWNPAEGVNLSDSNPYEGMLNVELFADYVGNYSFLKDEEISLFIDEHEQSLSFTFKEQPQPLLFINKDHFQTVNEQKVTFVRNEAGEVIGFKFSDAGDQIFERLLK